MSIARNGRTGAAGFAAALLGLGLAAGPAAAAESYDNCTHFILALPATLTQPGVWCLKGDLATSINTNGSMAVAIQANNVTLDCNGFKIGGLAGGAGTYAYGVGSDTSRLNTTIRNCNIRGFARGISLEYNGSGHLVENNRLEQNRVNGILVSGDGSVIRNNRVLQTGGNLLQVTAVGINAQGNVDVLDNLVSGITATSGSNDDAYGILAFVNHLGTVSGNRVREVSGDGIGNGWGIMVQSSTRTSIRGNEVASGSAAAYIGIFCNSALPSARSNTIVGFTAGLVGCADDGDNVSK